MTERVWDHLAATLEAENGALARLDLAGAGSMLAAKEAAFAATLGAAPPPPPLLAALGELARANQHLLERAIATQARVLALVASAARETAARDAPAPCYGAGHRDVPSVPLALHRSA